MPKGGDPAGADERYVLYHDGTFALQYLSTTYGFIEFPGRYSRAGSSIELTFDDWRSSWVGMASGTLTDGVLTVAYNDIMHESDFVDGSYVRSGR